MTRQDQTHWLRGNKGERTPRLVMVLDTESRSRTEGDVEIHAPRCWAAQVIDRGAERRPPFTCSEHYGTDEGGPLSLVQHTVKSGESWRLFTHNLSFDLALTRLPLDLIAAGWQLRRHNLASDAPWAHLARGHRSLWLCDSWSWLPRSVEDLGKIMGLAKPALPAEDDSDRVWLTRCRVDVAITTQALLRAMAEWDELRGGVWSITGPATGWNSYLHFGRNHGQDAHGGAVAVSDNPQARTHRNRVLIQPDAAARAFEREALYSGRRDQWRVGRLNDGPYAEIDLRTAHLAICASQPLPIRRWEGFARLDLDDWRVTNPGAGLVARALVQVGTPRYPLRVRSTVLHPVGRFWTTLATPELRDALARGELLEIGQGYGYHLGRSMAPWALWALSVLDQAELEGPSILSTMVKAWSRTVPGRWGMTHAQEIKRGPSHVRGWQMEPITVGSPPRKGYLFHIAGSWTEALRDQEADDSFPAVLSHIQSWTRLLLNRMLDAIPPEDLVSCNTEGAWVKARTVALHGLAADDSLDMRPPARSQLASGLLALSRHAAPLTVHIKQTADQLEAKSPQHLRVNGERQFAGIPRAAVETERDRFEFWTWPKLAGQMTSGSEEGYVRHRRKVNLGALPVSRWVYSDGCCEAVQVAQVTPNSPPVIEHPAGVCSRHGVTLRALQHPALRGALQA